MARRYRAQPAKMIALKLPIPPRRKLDPDLRKYFDLCDEKIGFLPNVLAAYSFDQAKLRAFMAMYNDLMLGESRLSKLEREMIAVVVSSANRCYYCLVAHGQAVRQISGDPQLGEMMVINERVAELKPRQRVMLDYAWKLTESPRLVDDADRKALAKAGFSEDEVFDINEVVGFFNLTNRMAHGLDMMPNPEYHAKNR